MKHQSPKSISPAFHSWQESLIAIKCSEFSSVLYLDNPLPARILGGSYKWIVFPRQSLLVTGKFFILSEVSVDTIRTLGLFSSFKFWPQPQVKPVVTGSVSAVCLFATTKIAHVFKCCGQWWLLAYKFSLRLKLSLPKSPFSLCATHFQVIYLTPVHHEYLVTVL